MFADLCVRTTEYDKALELGKALGLDMICFVVSPADLSKAAKARDSRDHREKPRFSIGTEVRTEKAPQLRKEIKKVRRSAEVIIVRGGTEELNRQALETPEADILINHSLGRMPGINHVLARLAKKNNVAIALDLNRVMMSNRLGRAKEFSMLADTAKLIRRFSSPFVLTCGAFSPWDLRSRSELTAFAKQLGFSEAQAKIGMTDSIVKENRLRLSGKWVMPGVDVE